jgi:CMD domain protein
MTTTEQEANVAASEGSFDIINQLAGLAPDSPLAQLRAQRADVLRYAQGSYLSLLEPEDLGGVSRFEREAIALRVAAITSSSALADWHRERLQAQGATAEQIAAVEQFPNGADLGLRLSTILHHTDRLSREPLNSSRADIETLQQTGLGARDIVVISQLISFLSFQVRTLASLRILAEEAA